MRVCKQTCAALSFLSFSHGSVTAELWPELWGDLSTRFGLPASETIATEVSLWAAAALQSGGQAGPVSAPVSGALKTGDQLQSGTGQSPTGDSLPGVWFLEGVLRGGLTDSSPPWTLEDPGLRPVQDLPECREDGALSGEKLAASSPASSMPLAWGLLPGLMAAGPIHTCTHVTYANTTHTHTHGCTQDIHVEWGLSWRGLTAVFSRCHFTGRGQASESRWGGAWWARAQGRERGCRAGTG